MSGTQLSFSLRLSSGIKTVHLLGSWDNYVGQLPLSKDKSASKGTWKGTFRFSNSALPPGQRYWYYYIIDGYHTQHNPSEPSTVEPTTGRTLNILDVGSKSHRSSGKSSSSKHHSSSKDKHHDRSDRHHSSSKRYSHSQSGDIPKGRPLSVSQIQQPMPVSPHATKHILESDYLDEEQFEHLTARFGSTHLVDDEYEPDDYGGDYYVGYENDGYGGGGSSGSSPLSSSIDDSSYMATSSGSDVSIRSDSSSPTGTSSLSGYSTPNSDVSTHCTCQRYGITRKGERVKMNCGGSRCGYGSSSGDSASSCSSSGDEAENCAPRNSSRRNGVVVRR